MLVYSVNSLTLLQWWLLDNNAPLSPVTKLQNKAASIINDVPLMEPIAPHYTNLRLLKILDIVKLNTSLLFYNYFNADKHVNWNLLLLLHDLTPEVCPPIFCQYLLFEQTSGNFVQQYNYR